MDLILEKPTPCNRPVTYKIIVRGTIDPAWFDRLEGMTISSEPAGKNTPATILEGEITDPSALAGIVISLYEQHRPIQSIKWSNIW